MTFLSMLGLITIISIFVFYLYVLCNLLDVAKSAWAKLLIECVGKTSYIDYCECFYCTFLVFT